MKRLIVIFALILIAPLTAKAETGIKNFQELLSIFHGAGFQTIVEVPVGNIYIHLPGDNSEEGTKLELLSPSISRAVRIPALDYLGPNKSFIPFMPTEYYRAYKVYESFLCYQYEGFSLAEKNNFFARCLTFPISIDQVLQSVQRRIPASVN